MKKLKSKSTLKTQKKLSEFYVIYMACPDNYVRFSDGWLPDKEYFAPDRDWYKLAANSDNVVITHLIQMLKAKKLFLQFLWPSKIQKET